MKTRLSRQWPSIDLKRHAAHFAVSTLQRVGAHAVDRAIWHLGLGRQGVRLTGSSLARDTDRWEAGVGGWTAAVVAEAGELLAHRALGAVFDLEGGESVTLESMSLRWLQAKSTRASNLGEGFAAGKIILEWPLAEREAFRRETLANLHAGGLAFLTAVGCNDDGLGVVQIELEIRAFARQQLSGAKTI